MSISQDGGCLCGALRFRVTAAPLWVTACFCRFCQRASGSLGIVEPIFDADDFAIIGGAPHCYTHVSAGSGKDVYAHFCAHCGTKTHLTFERWPDRLGIYAGTFDDPGWFEMSPANTRYIFLDSATRGTLVPPGYNTFSQHVATAEGEPVEPTVLDEVLHVR